MTPKEPVWSPLMKKNCVMVFVFLIAACGQSPEQPPEPELVIWTHGWEVGEESSDVDPVEPIDPKEDPIQVEDPNAQCADAAYLPPNVSVVVSPRGLEEIERCNGDVVRGAYFRTVVPPYSRVFTEGITDVRENCDTDACRYFNGINNTARPLDVVLEIAFYDDVERDVGIRFGELDANAQCSSATPLEVGSSIEVDPRRGGEFINRCELIDSVGSMHFFEIAVPLGRWTSVRAVAAQENNWSISIQALSPYVNDVCVEENLNACETFDDSYFRGSSVAEVFLDGTNGGGRDPSTVIIAISGSPYFDDPTYQLIVEFSDSPT